MQSLFLNNLTFRGAFSSEDIPQNLAKRRLTQIRRNLLLLALTSFSSHQSWRKYSQNAAVLALPITYLFFAEYHGIFFQFYMIIIECLFLLFFIALFTKCSSSYPSHPHRTSPLTWPRKDC